MSVDVTLDSRPRGEPGSSASLAPPALTYAAQERQGWHARLALEFAPRFGRTAIRSQSHVGPLRIQRPFYPERNGTCHVYVLHPPGGVVGGDILELEAEVRPAARALITTPGATKLYRSLGGRAQIRQQFELDEHACCEWFPQETIAFEGCEAAMHTRVRLAEGATYAGWEIVCLGRPAAGERFERGRLWVEHSIERAGKLQWIERAAFRGGDPMLGAPWGMAGHAVVGTFVVAPATPPTSEWVDDVRGALSFATEWEEGPPRAFAAGHFAVTRVSSALVLRYLGDRAHEATNLFRRAWQVLRPRYAGPAVAPRIWRT